MKFNPRAVVLVAFTTAFAALFGAPLIGLVVGLGLVIAAEFV